MKQFVRVQISSGAPYVNKKAPKGAFIFLDKDEIMKYLKQLIIILILSEVGNIVTRFLPIPIPGSVIGLILLYIALETKLIKLNEIETVGNYLKNNMSIMFVPLTVGILNVFDILKLNWINLTIVMVISTLLTMIATGKMADFLSQTKEHES